MKLSAGVLGTLLGAAGLGAMAAAAQPPHTEPEARQLDGKKDSASRESGSALAADAGAVRFPEDWAPSDPPCPGCGRG